MRAMTFQNLLEQLERKKPDLGEHIDTFNTFVGAAACLVGDSAAGGAAALINALAAKEKLFDLGKFLLDRVTGQKPDSYIGMADQMRTACGILCFTAFFETLDSLLPEDFRRELCFTPQEKQRLFPLSQMEAAPITTPSAVPRTGVRRTGAKPEGIPLPFPDTVYGSSGMDRDMGQFYRSMADRLASFVEKLSFYEGSETAKERWRAVLERLPEAAVSRFHDQYLKLCQAVPAFSIYIETEQRADFRAALESLPSRLKEKKVRETADRMRERYAADIARPVIEDPDGEDSGDSLRYPPLDEAFVPQRYRLLRFQDECRENRRPVRVVVTSRETLIDKADIPNGTAVMKLLEFDDEQKKAWIAVWNRYNRDILSTEGLEAFSLPDEKNIQKLSGQPLLLLMLAIYDADFETRTNALRRSGETDGGLDRTGLYDRLLRRFIRRELRKRRKPQKGQRAEESVYEKASDTERQAMENEEMKKLGVAALGMFVREKLSLTVGELDGDLQSMKARLPVYGQGRGRTLKSAEALLGSFFFLHKPEVRGDVEESEREFEFLHKTFYEFLLADLVLQYYADTLEKLRQQKSLNQSDGPAYVDTLDAMDKELVGAFYAALNGACLCVERETAEMIGEWAERRRGRVFQGDAETFKAVAEDLFWNHFQKIRDGLFHPAWTDGGLSGERSFPQLCAVYLMNLVTLRVLTCGEWRVPAEDWKYLAQYLKLNLPALKNETEHEWNIEPSEEVILKFILLIGINEFDGGADIFVHLQQWQTESKLIFSHLLYVKYWLAHFLQDRITRDAIMFQWKHIDDSDL